MPGLRPLTTSVHSRRCASRCGESTRAQASALTLRPRSATVTQAISSRSWPALAIPARSPGQPPSRAVPPAARAATAGKHQRRRTQQVAFQLRGQLARLNISNSTGSTATGSPAAAAPPSSGAASANTPPGQAVSSGGANQG